MLLVEVIPPILTELGKSLPKLNRKEVKMAGKKGDCGGTPRVGRKGDAKPRRRK